MAVESSSDRVMYVTILKENRSVRLLVDDKVQVTGTFNGLISYESTTNVKITVPACTASAITLSDSSQITKPQKNSEGQYLITQKSYQSLARCEADYLNEPLSFSAKVLQVMESSGCTVYRLAVGSSSDCVIYATLPDADRTLRILENDTVRVTGTSTGLTSYQSTYGGQITIPACTITGYSINDYTAVDVGEMDDQGFYKVTKLRYAEYARNPDPYIGNSLTFRAKVIQVVERDNGLNIYRVAVDSDSSKVFYVEYQLPSGASRILENDVVTLKGVFYGIYTYTTTQNSSISVPALLADEITK